MGHSDGTRRRAENVLPILRALLDHVNEIIESGGKSIQSDLPRLREEHQNAIEALEALLDTPDDESP